MEFNYEQIEKYLKGELAPADLENFELELSKSELLKEEVALYKDVEVALSNQIKFEKEDSETETILAELGGKYKEKNIEDTSKKDGEFEAKVVNTNKSTITRRLFPLATLAAAAALLLFIFNPFVSQLSTEQLADENFTPYTLESFMGDSGTDKILKKGKKQYGTGAYELALKNFNEYLEVNPGDTEIQLAKGCSQFKLNQTDAAIQTFQEIKNSSSAQWYLALAYLKKEETNSAKAVLESLLSDRQFGNKAEALLKQIK